VDVARIDVTIRRVLRLVAHLNRDPDALPANANLFDAGLKSLASLQLILVLEDEFGIEFPDDMFTRDSFSTIIRIRDSVIALSDVQRTSANG
jgi:acyl carrier protein